MTNDQPLLPPGPPPPILGNQPRMELVAEQQQGTELLPTVRVEVAALELGNEAVGTRAAVGLFLTTFDPQNGQQTRRGPFVMMATDVDWEAFAERLRTVGAQQVARQEAIDKAAEPAGASAEVHCGRCGVRVFGDKAEAGLCGTCEEG